MQALRSYSTEHNPDLELAIGELSSSGERPPAGATEPRFRFCGLGVGDVPGAGLEYLRAEHEVRYRQALFDMLIKQYDAARLDEAKDAAIIQVVEPAIEPDRRSSPKHASIILLSTAMGLLAAGLLVLLEWWNKARRCTRIRARPVSFTQLRRALSGKT